jgi:hypothetical protein
MPRISKFYNNATANVFSGTASTTKDIVSISGQGMVDYIVLKAKSNGTKIDNFVFSIDGNTGAFEFDTPFLNEVGIDINNSARKIVSNKKFLFNDSFIIQGVWNTTGTVNFKYSVLTNEMT